MTVVSFLVSSFYIPAQELLVVMWLASCLHANQECSCLFIWSEHVNFSINPNKNMSISHVYTYTFSLQVYRACLSVDKFGFILKLNPVLVFFNIPSETKVPWVSLVDIFAGLLLACYCYTSPPFAFSLLPSWRNFQSCFTLEWLSLLTALGMGGVYAKLLAVNHAWRTL